MSTQTIRNGASIAINLQAGETLKAVAVSGTYTLTGTAGSVRGTTIATAATGGTYGPYAAAVTVLLASSVSSEIDFDSGTVPVIDTDTVARVSSDGQSLVGGDGLKKSFLSRLGSVIAPFSLNTNALKVMASPPTITTNTTNTLAAGAFYAPSNQNSDAGVGSSTFSYLRGAYWRRHGSGYPDYLFVNADTFSQGSPSTYATNTLQYSFIHTGTRFSFFFKGTGTTLLIKVDGLFVSLTPISVANDGQFYYSLVDFGSLGTRRIDVIGNSLAFGGVYTDLTDSIVPAPKRGPRMVVLGDSFGEGSGNEVAGLWSWITYLAEQLGWDDVIASAVGSTGLIAGTLPKVPYGARAARDVAALNPAIVWVSQSINDSGSSAAAVVAAAQALVQTINNAGSYPVFVFSAPTVASGAGKIGAAVRQQNAAMKAWAATAGHIYVDDLEMPMEATFTPHSTTLSATLALNATTISTATPLIAGSHYKFADGTIIFARTSTTIDNNPVAQSSGATLTECGPTYLTGTGRVGATAGWGSADVCVSSDGTHPTNRGHGLKGMADANIFMRLQSP